MRILAFAASNSLQSINRKLVEYALSRLQEVLTPPATITLLDLNDYEMPIYSIDREFADGVPQAATDFYSHISQCDSVIASFPEHNGMVTAAWKNLYDWMSRIDAKVWQGKPIVLLSATPGPRAGGSVLQSLETLSPFFGASVLRTHGVGEWPVAWDDETSALTRIEDIEAIDEAMRSVVLLTGAR